MTTTRTLVDGTKITRSIRPCEPGDPTEGRWIRISATSPKPEQQAELQAWLEEYAAQLRIEDPERTVIVDRA